MARRLTLLDEGTLYRGEEELAAAIRALPQVTLDEVTYNLSDRFQRKETTVERL